jgi:cytochrome c oxidase subunit 2
MELKNWNFGFNFPASSNMTGIFSFHDDLMIFLTFIIIFVFYMILLCFNIFWRDDIKVTQKFVHASALEIIWTIIPALLLIVIAVPSFSLLYSLDENLESQLTFKILGNQWYWNYELIENESLQVLLNSKVSHNKTNIKNFIFGRESFDSYLIPEEELFIRDDLYSNIRLITVDNCLNIPRNLPVKLLVSSADVLHSWAIPSLGVKIDACPGRLNQTSILSKFEGLFYGQCSEICGVNHGFMPINLLCISAPTV